MYFEEEHINTLDMAGEMLLTVLSSVAQQESETISSHVRFGFEMKMRRGELIGFKRCFGYKIDKEKNQLKIVQKEAEAIKLIYKLYLNGNSISQIANILTEKKIKNYNNSIKWKQTSVNGILKNEKYVGDLIYGKSFVDPVTHKEVVNVGQQKKYYIKDHHEAIISREDFYRVQELLKQNASRKPKERVNFEKIYTSRNFTKKMRCGFCGKFLTINKVLGKYYWKCGSSKSKTKCIDSKTVREEMIENLFIESYNKLLERSFYKYNYFAKNSKKFIENQNTKKELNKAKICKEKYVTKMSRLVDLYMSRKINEYKFTNEQKELKKIICEYEEKINKYENIIADFEKIAFEIKKIKEQFQKNGTKMEEFDNKIFSKLVDYIIIGGKTENGRKNPYLIRFIYNNRKLYKMDKINIEESIVKNGLDNKMNKFIPILDFMSKQNFYYKEKDKNNKLVRKNLNCIRVRFEIEKVN